MTDTQMCARIQRSALAELPDRVAPEVVADCSGVTRVLRGLRPNRSASLVHSLDVDLPLRTKGATVATVHDLSVFDVPWAFTRFRATGEQALLKYHLHRADALIAVSQFTADRIGERFGRAATVTRLAPAPHLKPADEDQIGAVRSKYGLPPRFVLHVGTIEPRKDVAGLAEACRRIKVPLVLAGASTTALENTANVLQLGWVAAADLAALYGAATVVAYPSRYEGFGLPPIEALACGATVVTSQVGALPEVLGVAGYPLVPPDDPEALTELLGDAVGDANLRNEMLATGTNAIAKLSWKDTAKATLEVYQGLGIPVLSAKL